MSDNSTEHLDSAQACVKQVARVLDLAKERHWSSPGPRVDTPGCIRALREAMRELQSLRYHIINAAFELDGVDLEEP